MKSKICEYILDMDAQVLSEKIGSPMGENVRMKITIHTSLIALPLLALASAAQAAPPSEKVPNSYICLFKKEAVSRGNVESEAAKSEKAAAGRLKHVYAHSIHGFAINASAQGVANMAAHNPNIKGCYQDEIVTVTSAVVPGDGAAGGGRNDAGGGAGGSQQTPWGIARVGGGYNASTKTAWIIDSGIDLDHPDLNVDTARSKSFVSNRPSPDDQHGHGTHVAGTLAAKDNTIGVIGVAAGAKVVAVRVLDHRNRGPWSEIIAGINYVAQYGKPGDVANLSVYGGVYQPVDDAVIAVGAKGIKIVICAGNDSEHTDLNSPSRADGPNVYTVSSVGSGDVWSSFSNYGNPPVDWAGPGGNIYSTYLNGGYSTMSGTSMATPHVAGLLLLGSIRVGGYAVNDPDGYRDPIAVY